MRKILVTGGLGFVGSHLVESLCNAENEVVVLDNQSTGSIMNIPEPLRNKTKLILGDIRDERAVEEAMDSCDAVFHLAVECLSRSLIDPLLVHSVNATGSLVLLMLAKKLKVKSFVYVSSSEVYGTAKYAPMDESHPLNPHTVYASAKLSGEKYSWSMFKTHNLPVTIVRPFNIFGPRQRGQHRFPNDIYGSVISKFAYSALRNENLFIYGNGKQSRDFTYVTDAVKAIIRAGENKRNFGRIINIASGKAVTVKDIAKEIINLTGSSSKVIFLKKRPGDVDKLLGSNDKAKKLLNFSPEYSFKEGLREYIEWSKNNQPSDK